MSLAGQVALVTGAGSGIGQGSAVALAEAGAAVVAADINLAAAQATAGQIEKAGGRATALQVDLANSASCHELVAQTLAWGDRVDILFNSAGVATARRTPIAEMSDEEWRRVNSVNLDGTFYICRAVIPPMIKQSHGAIILMSSGRANLGAPYNGAYGASKGGVASFTKGLAWEVGKYNINVNCLAPGPTDTPMFRSGGITEEQVAKLASADPMKRISTPAEVAKMVVFLAGEGHWITGQLHVLRMYSR